MIQIKDMEMPKRCAECKICINQKTNDYGTYGKCLLQNKNVNCLQWSRDTNCPLVESENNMESYLEDNRPTLDELCMEYDECTEECPAYEFCHSKVENEKIYRRENNEL